MLTAPHVGVSLHEDVMRWEAHRVYSERLHVWRQRRRVEGDAELVCPLVTNVGRSLPDTSTLADRNTLHPFHVSLKRRKRKLASASLAPFEFPHFFSSMFLQRLSRGSAGTLVSPTELTQAWEVDDGSALVSACEGAEGPVWKVTLLEGELVEARCKYANHIL
jgi:hypothetical protein